MMMMIEELRQRIIDRMKSEDDFNKEFHTTDMDQNSYGAGYDTGFRRALQLVLNAIDYKDADNEEII